MLSWHSKVILPWRARFQEHTGRRRCTGTSYPQAERSEKMAYKEKDTKTWTAQWFERNARGENKNEERGDLLQNEKHWNMNGKRS